MSRYIKLTIGLGLFIIVFTSCKKNYDDLLQVDDDAKSEHIIVDIVDVTREEVSIPIYAIGKVGTANETRLSFKVGGIIESLNVNEGDYIKKGQTISSLRKTEINAHVNKAQRAYEKSLRDLERVQKMYDDKAATLENVQDLQTLVEVQKADLEIAKFNEIYATIISPVSGRVIKKLAEENEVVAPGQPIAIIAGKGTQSYVLKTGVSDKDINRVRVGDFVEIVLDAFGEETMDGYVSKISESANPITGTFDIEIGMKTGKKRVRNGYVGRAEIRPKQTRELSILPISSLIEVIGDDVSVYTVVNDSIVNSQIVKPIYISKDHIYVNGDHGLENVITTGADYVAENVIVQVNQSR